MTAVRILCKGCDGVAPGLGAPGGASKSWMTLLHRPGQVADPMQSR